ncbi:MAG: HAD family hydrolase [Chitinophagaceae bacterium]
MKEHSTSSIAFFDFDGTITSKDTLAEILKFAKGKFLYYLGLIVLSPILIAYKLRLLSNHRAKEIMLMFFLGGMRADDFEIICKEFSEIKLPELFRKAALHEIRRHLQNNTQVVVVSASPANWVLPWCEKFNIDCIATCLEIKDEKITGRITGRNCHGKEKVKLIQKKYNLSHYNKIYAYGDTRGDLPMLSLSTDRFYKPFKEKIY